ncbi:uncharacterized protein LOC108111934 isoform X2 [Drosophila eugracilis]|uniref:uncharacterized protein LOC108111934 isoform X2 n=1 Tax=Drosophila eugracilis TaxID=29029 RepID=UPI0007E6731C|nr:uncharacterized protein LOC108111934 isoform X2 [Drosophila eugracilis]
MSEEHQLLKPILILREEGPDAIRDDGVGNECSRSRKHVTFNRVVEYFCYTENNTSWKRQLIPDNDLRRSMPPESKTCFAKN